MGDAHQRVVTVLRRLAEGSPLGEQAVAAAFDAIMEGQATPAQVGALLLGLRMRGEDADEIVGVARALRGAMIRVPVPDGVNAIDTCGTGGGSVPTFNISTAAALVVAGAGARVAKHGNRSHTSRCGSADVLEALDVPVARDASEARRQFDDAGVAFLFAPTFHPAMRFVAAVRRELGVPTVMNVVGPLANPAGVRRQVVGVADPRIGLAMATALGRLGSEHAVVVFGEPGLDEVSPAGRTRIWETRGGSATEQVIEPEDLGVTRVERLGSLAGGEPEQNAARLEQLLRHPDRDPAGSAAVLLNAGLGLYVAGVVPTPREGVESARASLHEGAGGRVLDALRASLR
ncbi:MAG TPA: anthranilate phosphoribosyltransferase [Gemmatimonadales bacterium]|jgi:anthranilate phosphoribosyltransferase